MPQIITPGVGAVIQFTKTIFDYDQDVITVNSIEVDQEDNIAQTAGDRTPAWLTYVENGTIEVGGPRGNQREHVITIDIDTDHVDCLVGSTYKIDIDYTDGTTNRVSTMYFNNGRINPANFSMVSWVAARLEAGPPTHNTVLTQATDQSGNGNHFTNADTNERPFFDAYLFETMPNSQPCYNSEGFDDHYNNLTNPFDFTSGNTPFYFSTLVKNSTSNDVVIFSLENQGFSGYVKIDTTASTVFVDRDKTGSGTATIPADSIAKTLVEGTYIFVELIKDAANNMTLYVDGVAGTPWTDTGPMGADANSDWFIGQASVNGRRFPEAMFINQALTNGEIKQLRQYYLGLYPQAMAGVTIAV